MKREIDITTTATLRPALLNRTYASFRENLFNDSYDYRVIINIDPLGKLNGTPEEVVKIARKYFKNVIFNAPKEPSFAKAWKWTWMQVEADLVFHLEEDWVLQRRVSLAHMISILDENRKLAALRMPKMNLTTLHFFGGKHVKRQGYLLALNEKKAFGGNPQLVRGDFVKATRNLMKDDRNPEKQFRAGYPEMYNIIKKWQFAVYGKLGDRMLVRDIGRTWMRQNKFEKDGGAGFLKWKKK